MAVPEEDAERLPILGSVKVEGQPTETVVYARRWWVLTVFSLASFVQAIVWNTWGPVTESSEEVFGWDDSNIGMLANYGNIAYIIFVLPVCYFMDVKGLRIAMLACSFLILLGTAIRCITLEPVAATWLANACAVVNGAAGSVPFAGPALLSSVWFPPDQRATATAIASFFNYFGVAMAFIFGPQIVTSPTYTNDNKTVGPSNIKGFGDEMTTVTPEKNCTNLDTLKSDIKDLLYVHCGMAAGLFILTVIYFPSRPPSPPSNTASIERTKYKEGLLKLASNRAVWLIVLAYALPSGVLGVWASVLDVNLKSFITQKDAGWMGFWQTLAGCTAGLFVARFSDLFMKRMKLFLIILFIGAIGSTVWFTLLCNKYIDLNLVSLYASCILIGLFINGSIPLFYEISCEASYPVAEGVTGGFLTMINNLVGIMFLMVMLDKNLGTAWMNWVLLGSVVLALPMLFIFPERYRRTDLDITIIIPPPEKDIQTDEDNNDDIA